ncbi:MAG: hypothetical protein V4857_17265 [Pseudomonadota bacterium]
MLKKNPIPVLMLGLLGTLAACGGGGTDAPPPPPTHSMTFTPSLGKVLNAVVQLKLADGTLLASADTGSAGTVTFNNVPQNAGPLLVDVLGNASAIYYDEATNSFLPFGPERLLRAAVTGSAANGNIGVTAFTTMAVARALQLAGGLNAANIAAANGAIGAAFKVPDILAAPALVGSFADMAGLQNTAAGHYALRLAALAKMARTHNATIGMPALAMLEAMTKDMADGVLDGKQGADLLSKLPYSGANFGADWLAAAQALGANNSNLLSFMGANNFGVAWSGAPAVPPLPPPPDTAPGTPPVNMPPTGVWLGSTLNNSNNCRVTIEANGLITIGYNNAISQVHYSGVAPDAFDVTAGGNAYTATSNLGTTIAQISTVYFRAGVLDVSFVLSAGPPPTSVMCHKFVKQ